MVQNLGKAADIARRITGGVVEGSNGCCSRHDFVLHDVSRAKFSQELQEILGVGRIKFVTANALFSGVFPTKKRSRTS